MKNKKKEIASITLSLAFCVSMIGSMASCGKKAEETTAKREVNEVVTEEKSFDTTTSGTALEVTTRHTASGVAIVTTRFVTEGKTDSTTGKTTTESASERTSGVTTRVITTESTTGATTTEEVTWATTRETTTEYTTEATTRSTTESTTEQTTRETTTESTTESTTEATTRATTRETTTESTTEATTVHQHKWIWKTHTETVHHDAETHLEPYYDEGWTEYIYERKCHCSVCKKFYDSYETYCEQDFCLGSYSMQDVLVDTIEHEPEILGYWTIIDKPAWDEEVVVKDYEYCSECGEKK